MMKKVLLVLMVMVSLKGYSQIAISQLPTYTGNPSGGYVPIVIGGATKKIDASKFTTGAAILANNNNFTGAVDTFKTLLIASPNGTNDYSIKANGIVSTPVLEISSNDISAISTDGTFTTGSNNLTLPTQQAVKTYVDAKLPYKVLSVIINYNGSTFTNTILSNTIGDTYTFAASSNYYSILGATAGSLPTAKTVILTSAYYTGSLSYFTRGRHNFNPAINEVDIDFIKYDNSTSTLPNVSSFFIEIRVYP